MPKKNPEQTPPSANTPVEQPAVSESPDLSDTEMKMPEYGVSNPIEEKTASVFGIILAVLIVLLVLILAGLYLWSTTLVKPPESLPEPAERPTIEENNEPESNNAEADVQTIQTVSTSDELDAIEADLESEDFAALDAELEAIEAEMEAEMQ